MDSTKFESEKQRRERNWLKIRIGVLRLVWLVGPPYFVAPSADAAAPPCVNLNDPPASYKLRALHLSA